MNELTAEQRVLLLECDKIAAGFRKVLTDIKRDGSLERSLQASKLEEMVDDLLIKTEKLLSGDSHE